MKLVHWLESWQPTGRFRVAGCLFICVLAFLVGCERSESFAPAAKRRPSGDTGPIHVVTTVGMVADLVREVGGERVSVTQLMGPGVDPHLYKGTRDDVRAIIAADLVFYSGLMLEGKVIDMLEKVGRKKPVIAVTDALKQPALAMDGGDALHPDPHVWMDVALWAQCVHEITRGLRDYDEEGADAYREATSAYLEKLMALDAYGKKVISTIPPEGRVLITSHDAFHYFGRAYGLEVFGVQGLSTDSEAGLRQINNLVDMIVKRKISAVFVESSVPPKSIMAVIDGAASRGHRVVVGGELYSDAMGERGSYEGTYVGMLDHNLTTVARALGGMAPERGMQGLLKERQGGA